MKKNVLLFLLLIPFQVLCQSQLPASDIWMMRLVFKKGIVQFTDPKNITNKPGYENQPCYSRDGKSIFYTVQSDTSLKTAIYRYAISTGETRKVTFTIHSPFSPMPSPAINGISVLMLEENSTQRIWDYPFSGAKPYPLFANRDSIGYYAWVDDHTVLAYILAGKNPSNRLSLIKADGTEKKIAENVGRGIKVVGKGAFFIQKKDSVNYLAWTDFEKTNLLVTTPGGSEHLVIYEDQVLMASGGTIYGTKMKKEKGHVVRMEEFKPLQDLSTYGLKNITRMAISPDEKTIAVAVNN